MAKRRKYRFIQRQDFSRTQLSKTAQVYAAPGNKLRKKGASKPKIAASIQGSSPTTGYQRAPFANGLDAWKITVADNTKLVADTSFIRLNGKNVLFVTADTPGKITIGANAAATKANINTFLNGLKGYAPKPLTSAVVGSDVVVKGTGKHPNDAFTVSTNQSDALTIANVTSTDGVASTMVAQLEGDIFIPGIQTQFDFPLDVNDDDQTVSVISISPEDTDDIPLSKEVTVAAWKAALDAALNGSGIDESQGFIHSNKLANYEAIKTALRDVFGDTASDAFVISGDELNILTITYGTKGTIGNGQYMDFIINPSIPQILSDLYLGENDEPIIDEIGPLIPIGSTQGVNSNDTNSTATVPQDSAKNNYGTGVSGIDSEFTVTFNDIYDAFNQRLGLGTGLQTKTGQRDVVLPGGGDLEIWGIVIVVDSHLPSMKHIEIIPEVQFVGGLALELTKASVKGGQLKGSILADNSASPTKIRGIARQVKQV